MYVKFDLPKSSHARLLGHWIVFENMYIRFIYSMLIVTVDISRLLVCQGKA
jgi:hypothetical protein